MLATSAFAGTISKIEGGETAGVVTYLDDGGEIRSIIYAVNGDFKKKNIKLIFGAEDFGKSIKKRIRHQIWKSEGDYTPQKAWFSFDGDGHAEFTKQPGGKWKAFGVSEDDQAMNFNDDDDFLDFATVVLSADGVFMEYRDISDHPLNEPEFMQGDVPAEVLEEAQALSLIHI